MAIPINYIKPVVNTSSGLDPNIIQQQLASQRLATQNLLQDRLAKKAQADAIQQAQADALHRQSISSAIQNGLSGLSSNNSNTASNDAYVPSGSNLSAAQAAYKAGFRGNNLLTALAVALAESGGRPTAHNPNAGTGDNSYGLFQINMLGNMGPSRLKAYGLKSNNDLFDPATNARVAYAMSKGGANWKPWTTYTSGKYRGKLNTAQAMLKQLGYL